MINFNTGYVSRSHSTVGWRYSWCDYPVSTRNPNQITSQDSPNNSWQGGYQFFQLRTAQHLQQTCKQKESIILRTIYLTMKSVLLSQDPGPSNCRVQATGKFDRKHLVEYYMLKFGPFLRSCRTEDSNRRIMMNEILHISSLEVFWFILISNTF